MSIISPSKRLFDFELTPAKQVVSCDINSWMETQSKQGPSKTLSCRVRLPKPIKSMTQSPQSSLAQLRERRETLLRSTSKRKIGKVEMKTADSSNGKISSELKFRFNS